MRYQQFSSIGMQDDIKFYYGMTKEFNLKDYYEGEMVYHTIATNDSLSRLSYSAYNTPNFWWVLALYNGIKDPFFELEVNSEIQIPLDVYQLINIIKRESYEK